MKRGKCAIVDAAILPYRLRCKRSSAFRARIPWQSVDEYFLNLLSVSCVMWFLIHAIVNLQALGFYPSPYFLETYGQLGDDIDGRGWEEKNSQMPRNSASRSVKSLFYGLALILNNRIEEHHIQCTFFFMRWRIQKGLLGDSANHNPLTAVMRVNKANLKLLWQPFPCHEIELAAKCSGLSTKQLSKLAKSFV